MLIENRLIAYTLLPAWLLIMGGGVFFILIGIALYLFRQCRPLQWAAFVVLTMLFDFIRIIAVLGGSEGFAISQMFTDYYEWFGVFAVVPMMLYNGRRGRGLKRLFYVFYPAHIYLLYALSWGVYLILN